MNIIQNSSYTKLIAFFLIIVSLLSVLVVSAQGWQIDDNSSTNNSTGNNSTGKDNDLNKENTITEKFYHHITGLELPHQSQGYEQVAYVIDTSSPLCGIAGCNVLIEFPLENARTRFLMITDKNANLTKIGSITYTRHYISNIAKAFGATIVSLGNDDTISYNHIDMTKNTVDLSGDKSLYYTEYTYFSYTNNKILESIISEKSNLEDQPLKLPYIISKEKQSSEFEISANKITLPYDCATELSYQNDDKCYVLSKMGSDKIDVSTQEKVTFNNVFILFADSATYETSDSTQMVINTMSKGLGYYATNGVARSIVWNMDEEGQMTFLDENGEILSVTSGNFYIGYVKSSKSNNEFFS